MTKWQALWKTMRPLNLLIMALTMIGMYGALFNQLDGIEVDHFLFGVLTLSIVLLGAGGNVINDIEDVVVDAINKPGKNQIGVSISRTRAMNWYFILTLTGLLMGLIVSTIQKDLLLFLIILFIAVSLWFYTRWMQKQVLIGNFVVGVLCGLLPVISLLFCLGERTYSLDEITFNIGTYSSQHDSFLAALQITKFYTLFAFLLTLTREIAKDMEDMTGDSQAGYRTLPIVVGFKKTGTIIWAMLILTILILGLSFFELGFQTSSQMPMSITGPIILLVCIMIIVRGEGPITSIKKVNSISKYLKITMALGIATTAFFWFL